jgi:hypothetical protein
MPLDLADYGKKANDAVRTFWRSRAAAGERQGGSDKPDRGERASVTAGKNMNGFLGLMIDVMRLNGLPDAEYIQNHKLLTLPGYFRPTKRWDLLAIGGDQLIAAIELKSHVGPSFGNNFNNRAEEAIGTAHDLWTAYREGAFGAQRQPFVGWLIMVEDAPESRRRRPCSESPHFPVFEPFGDTSYLERYDLLCQRLMRERLYTAAAVVTTKRRQPKKSTFGTISERTSLKAFVTSLAGHATTIAEL